MSKIMQDLSLGVPLDFEEKYANIAQGAFAQSYTFTDMLEMEYRFRSTNGPENGCDTDGKRIFYNLKHQLIVLPLQNCNADDLPHYAVDHPIEGKLTYHDNMIYAIERAKGLVQVYDIYDLEHIRTKAYFHTNASCEKAVIINDRVFIPGWYGGLLELI